MVTKKTFKVIVIFLFFFIISCTEKEEVIPVEWEKTYGHEGDDQLYYVDTAWDGGLWMAGTTASQTNSERAGWLVKSDPNGVKISEEFFESGISNSIDISMNPLGGLVYAHTKVHKKTFLSSVDLLFYDTSGELVKVINLEEESNLSVSFIKTFESGDVLAGLRIDDGKFGGLDFSLILLDKEGNIIWDKNYGTWDHDYIYDAELTDEGDILICGSRYVDSAGSLDHYIAKLNTEGEIIWEQLYGGIGAEISVDIEKLFDGNFVICGGGEILINDESLLDYHVFFIDSDGEKYDEHIFGGERYEFALRIIPEEDGGYFLAGRTWGNDTNHETVWVIHSDKNGNILDERTFLVSDNTFSFPIEFLGVEMRSPTDMILTGYKQNATNDLDAWIYRAIW